MWKIRYTYHNYRVIKELSHSETNFSDERKVMFILILINVSQALFFGDCNYSLYIDTPHTIPFTHTYLFSLQFQTSVN